MINQLKKLLRPKTLVIDLPTEMPSRFKLETKRLNLRGLLEKDSESLIEICNEPEVLMSIANIKGNVSKKEISNWISISKRELEKNNQKNMILQ